MNRIVAQWHANRMGWLAVAAIALLALGWAITAPPPLPSYKQVRARWQPSESWLYDRDGNLLDETRLEFNALRLRWATLDQISPALRSAVIAQEDHRFKMHGGVDWIAAAGAIKARFSGQNSRGASTLSMQLAAFLTPELSAPGARSWRDKARQVRAAWALEGAWTKDEILEAYLNRAHFRGETQGVVAAASHLFGKAPGAVDKREAALMAALLPDPGATGPRLAARACRRLPGEDCVMLAAMATRMLSPGQMQALDPGHAPHLAARLLDKPGMRVTTTIDSQVQKIATQALSRQLQGLGPKRARDGAVVVLDNASGDVLAYVGGVGLGSTAAQVDGAGALRQAGSTLKPFLYAQLIERKWLTAASILDDSPVQLDTASGLYVPRNYDKTFLGPVSVRRALANSLNVPAVRALQIGGVQDFRDRLWDIGFTGLTGEGDYYGFSLALGSAEVTLVQQANAYRTLANLGRWSPARLKADDPRIAPRALIDPAAAWIVGDILSDASARATTFGSDSALRLPFWAAAKTGTSKAMRDNWCIGFSDRFTVAVWVGNLEGDPMRSVSGTSGAAPVWRDVMLALHRDRPGSPPLRPNGLDQFRIQFASGSEPPRSEWFIAGTGQSSLIAAATTARRPRIMNPVSGSVFAYDPDIPSGRQYLGVKLEGADNQHRLALNGRALGSATAGEQIPLLPGSHVLALLDRGGRSIDQVLFTVHAPK